MQETAHSLRLKRLGISTYKESVVYLHKDSHICRAEGFEAQSRIKISYGKKTIIATLNIVNSSLIALNEAGLSEFAWESLGASEGGFVNISHSSPLNSMNHIRTKINGGELDKHAMNEIIHDVVDGNLSDIQISAFLTSSAGERLNIKEITLLTEAMLSVGSKISWDQDIVVDKHCIGGLPGNRTTIIVVPIVAAFGLAIPKTSSHAITSSAGTADTMETLAPVDLTLDEIKKVVNKENGCVVWGGRANLSPADEILIRIERVLNIDSQGQVVASVLSKKIAIGSTNVLIDIPLGPSSKIRTEEEFSKLDYAMRYVGERLGIKVVTVCTDGTKPIGRGIGPALEAHDVLAVLQNKKNAPLDLKEKSLMLAGHLLEFSKKVAPGSGRPIAESILESGKAWEKFQAICEAQGGMRVPTKAPYTHPFLTHKSGTVKSIDNYSLSQLAKLAGAPKSKAAGVYLEINVGSHVEKGEPLLVIHAESPGELDYALGFLKSNSGMIEIIGG